VDVLGWLRLHGRTLRDPKQRFLLGELVLLGCVLLVIRLSLVDDLALVGVGVIGWVFFEYFLHRFVLHAKRPPQSRPALRALFDGMHHDHHVHADDPHQLFISQRGSFVMLTAVLLGSTPVLGIARALPITLGFGMTMFEYGVMHLCAHSDYVPRTAYGRYMKAGHLAHHETSTRGWFGVVTPLLDYVFGTWQAPGRAR
jgi:sterol desaturase/sphingolipid hydroxylase (fatty acid hydroxylase superfamily)